MKISKLFHWLYFAVMMLPIFVIPIFALAVRSDNNFSPISVQREETYSTTTTYDLEQLIFDGQPSSDTEWEFEYVEDYNIVSNGLYVDFYADDENIFYTYLDTNVTVGDKLYFKFWAISDSSVSIDNFEYCFLYDIVEDERRYQWDFVNILTDASYFSNIYTVSSSVNVDQLNFQFINPYSYSLNLHIKDIQLFNLTSIFGVGNEPTLAECDSIFSLAYYDYGTNYDYVVTDSGTHLVTYSDTDVGSQMVYVTYQAVDNYFNYDNVFNFGSLYSWLELNFFSGNAPLGFFIFWHLLIYWLLTSLIWLLFDVLMYVPLLVHRWLDKASIS